MIVMKVLGCIYLLRNLKNGKGYVGKDKTGDPENHRWASHINTALRGKSKYILHRAIRKAHRESNGCTLGFSAEILWRGPVEKLNEKETYYIEKLCTYVLDSSGGGYNLTKGGDGMVGHRHGRATRKRMSQTHAAWFSVAKNRTIHKLSLNTLEARANASAAQKRRFARMTKKDRAAFSAKMSRVEKNRYKDPAAHAVMRRGQRRRFKDPAKRAANAAAHRTTKFRTTQSEGAKAQWSNKASRKRSLAAHRAPKYVKLLTRKLKRAWADPEVRTRHVVANLSPKAQKSRKASLLSWYAEPKNKKKHLKSHRTEEFRAKKSRNTKSFWRRMTTAERSVYWRQIHPHGTKKR
jgi:hypothetical protein